ncbi:hypothetical protein KM043_017401 [Ampulex compressa]|nr:hypothetical protein KM043_017401 [Ampulex compressa]
MLAHVKIKDIRFTFSFSEIGDSAKDAFGSLESLFDVKKPLQLPDIRSIKFADYALEHSTLDVEVQNSKPPKDFIELLIAQTASGRAELEPHILERTNDINDHYSEQKLEKGRGTKVEEIEHNRSILDSVPPINMAEVGGGEVEGAGETATSPQTTDEAAKAEEVVELEEGAEDTQKEMDDGIEVIPEEEEDEPPIDKGLTSTIKDIADEGGDKLQGEPPSYPIPPGIGEGVPIKPGGRRESVLSSSPLADTAVMNEMKAADERCIVIAKEIDQLKQEISDLTNKPDLTEEDTIAMQEKQNDIMSKLAEFEEITQRIQQLLGLTDVSSTTFAEAFGLLPYPHTKSDVIITEEMTDEEEDTEKGVEAEVGRPWARRKEEPRVIGEEDRFDLPQVEYPEDKLPRVIVCGYTEDEIPKIVVADSERKGKKKCLQTLTGKLTESLSMQEKLVKENAQLEGGKYRLEEALLEKDSAVESLQRKVCGLQAEMRIVVKENTELSRQLATLNQRVTSPTCCSACPGGTGSVPSTPSPLRPYSYSSSLQQDDSYCRCKCCLRPQFADTFSPTTDTACVNPDTYGFVNEGSPRLGGGASRTKGFCLKSESSSEAGEMCCRSPAAAKSPCPGPAQRGTCPAELENKLAIYGNSTKQLEQQLGSMETEVRSMQIELANVQRERQQLEQQRKLLKCSGPCAPCACCPPPACNLPPPPAPCYSPPPAGVSSILPPPGAPLGLTASLSQIAPHPTPSTCIGPCITAPMGTSTCPQQQLRDLREQYARLQDDYKSKLCEVSCLRADAEKLKQENRDVREEKERMEIKMIDAQERLKILQAEREKFEGYKEQMVEQEQSLLVAKQRFREAQDELEELRSLIQDQAAQLEDYRNKYLQAQQQVEEQRRQLDLMEMDNARMNENVTLEIGRVKNQFQEKLAELAPLPDILKQTQVKLQEAQQMRLVAEHNCEDLSRELLGCKDKIQTLQNQLDVLRTEHQALQDERGHGSGRFEEMERKNSELRHQNERMKNTLARFEEHEAQLQKRIDEKLHEITQLSATLEQVREDSARHVARMKERCETVRRTMQGQIAEMERQLAQCRATARAAEKDRDEIRQKMQGQINNLNEAFEQAQGRIRSLQGHVNYLNTSYSNIFKGQGEVPASALPVDTPGGGYDSCDCNY